MGFLGDVKEWVTWWGEEQRKRREELRAQQKERREESKDLRGILDEQIREVEAWAKGAPAEDERSERHRSLDELRRRKVVLLETQIRSHQEYEAFTAKLGAGQESRGSLSGFQMPELALPSGEPQPSGEAIAAMRLDVVAVGFGQAGRHELAELVFAEALTLDSRSASRWYNRGVARQALGRHEEALADYNRSLELRPDDPDTLMGRGSALHRLGGYEQALADYNRSLELRPDHPDTLYNRGLALLKLGRHEEALADYNRSLELRPDDADTLSTRGLALLNLGRHEEALADYDRSLELRPDHPLTLFNRACVFGVEGKVEQAIDDLRRAIAGDPRYCEMARTEPHLDPIRSDPRFRALVGEDEPPREAGSP